MGSLLAVDDLTVRFGGLTAVNRVSLELPPAGLVGLIGPNGSGKTTLFNTVSGLLAPAAGTITLDGVTLNSLAPHERSALGMSRTFQAVAVYSHLSVLDNVLVGAHLRLPEESFWRATLRTTGVRRTERRAEQEAMATLDLLGIASLHGQRAGDLPFGAQRAVELARAIVGRPRLLLLDEPASGLDTTETEELRALLKRIRRELDITIFVVDHDMSFLLGLVEYVFVLDFGTLIAQGTPARIKRDHKVLEAYLGQEAVGALG